MRTLIIFGIAGALAQFVDGALGMAFGVTATTALMISGVTAAHASFAVHLAEVGTTLASGLSHWRFDNVDMKVVLRLGVPGAIGAFLGATVLSGLSTAAAVPVTTTILLLLGVYLMFRFSRLTSDMNTQHHSPHGAGFLSPLGFFGGFIDASGGGGWGPITSSAMLTAGKTTPRRVIGSVAASEFLVSIAASLGFLIGLRDNLGDQGMIVLGLLAGGVLVAPIAAWFASRLSPWLLGTFVGAVLVLSNARRLGSEFNIDTSLANGISLTIILLAAVLIWRSFARRKATTVVSEPVQQPVSCGRH